MPILPAAHKAVGIELVAVCDASERLASEIGRRNDVASTTSVDALLAWDLDAVVVATPDRFHADHASAVLDSGRHVLVEKPLAPSAEESRWFADLASRRGLKLQVGAMKRHDPGVKFAHGAVARFGPMLSVSCWYRVMSALRPPTEATLFPDLVVDDEVRGREATFISEEAQFVKRVPKARLAVAGA